MQHNKTGIILSIAAAALLSTVSVPASADHGMSNGVKCMGANSCKGRSACKTATNSCKGQNSCKGKGFIMTSSAQHCTKQGGTVAK